MLRLTSAADFERVRRDGRSHAHPLVVLIACRRPESLALPTRCGFMAGKRVGTAVARNRAKRRLREAVRARWPDVEPGWDLIWIARQPVVVAAWPEVQQAIEQLLRRARVMKTNG